LLPCKWQGKIENFSRNRLINPSWVNNHVAAHKVLPLHLRQALRQSRYLKVMVPHPVTYLFWNWGKIMFHFIPEFIMVVMNKTLDLMISFFTVKHQQQGTHFKIPFHNMIFPKIQFPFISKNPVIWSPNTFSVALQTGPCNDKYLLDMQVSPAILSFKVLAKLA
jgi:hypothetical protein